MKAATVLIAATFFGVGQQVWANETATEPKAEASNQANTSADMANRSTAEDFSAEENKMITVTVLEAEYQGTMVHAEQIENNFNEAKEALAKAKQELETIYSDASATEADKVGASVSYQYVQGYYEASVELKNSSQQALEEIEKALAEAEPEKSEFESSLESMDKAVQLKLYYLKRQVIEELLAEEELAYQTLQDLAEVAKKAFEEATPENYTLDEYKELAYAYGRADALASVTQLTYDYNDIDAKIKSLEDELATGASSDKTEKLLVSAEQAQALLDETDKPTISPSVSVTIPMAELLDKLAATTSKEGAEALIAAYISVSRITGTKSAFDKVYQGAQADYNTEKAIYENKQQTLINETDRLLNELTHRILLGYATSVGQMYGNYPYLVQSSLDEATNLVNSAATADFSSLSKEKQAELLEVVRQALVTTVSGTSRENVNKQRFLQEFQNLLQDKMVTESDLLSQAQGYGYSQAWFSPIYTYDFTDLDNRIDVLAKSQGNNQKQSENPMDKSGKTERTDELTQTSQLEENDKTLKADVIKQPVAGTATVSQVKTLPTTGETYSDVLSALGLMSLVASVGLVVKKHPDEN